MKLKNEYKNLKIYQLFIQEAEASSLSPKPLHNLLRDAVIFDYGG